MPTTAFQDAILDCLLGGELADLSELPIVEQHPYVNPQGGAANQYLTVDWVGKLRIFVYDDEVGFDEFTLEREDFPTLEAQMEAMIEEIERLRGTGG